MSRAEKIETSTVRALGVVLVLVMLGCGFGVQHIAYTRQLNRLSREVQQRETELSAVTQAYRSLESYEALRAADNFQLIEARSVVGEHLRPNRRPEKVK